MKLRKLLILGIPLLLTKAGAGIFTLFDPLNSDKSTGASIKTGAFVADDPVSLGDLLDKWHGEFHPKNGTNLAIDDMRFDIGASSNRWGYLGYTYRHQSFTAANRDTVELAWRQLNDIGFTPGRVYSLDISIEGFEADGIVYAKSFELMSGTEESLKIGVGIELLRGRNMQYGYLNGYAVADSSKDYDFSAAADYYYTENYLYNLDVQKPDGNGYTFHLGIGYKIEGFSLRLLANDLFGKIVWKRLPYSYVNINSANKSYDENGFVIYNPTISGVEKYVNRTQRLYAKWKMEASYSKNRTIYSAGADFVKDHWFPYIVLDRTITPDIGASLEYESRFSTLGLTIGFGGLKLSIKSNDLKNPSALGAAISYTRDF